MMILMHMILVVSKNKPSLWLALKNQQNNSSKEK